MRPATKRFGEIPNATKLGQRRRMGSQVQYEYEILNELSQLGREKVWLNKEKENWQERINRINNRLLDIEKVEETLIQKQIAMKDQISLDVKGGSQTSDKEAREVVIKY